VKFPKYTKDTVLFNVVR